MSTRCARPPRRYGPSGDTPSAPRLGWQLWALRPGLDGASRPSTTLTGRRPTAGFRDGALDRNRLGPAVPAVHDISAARGGSRLPGRAPHRSRRRGVAVGVGGGANSRGRRGSRLGCHFHRCTLVNTTSRAGSRTAVSSRWEETDQGTSLRSDERSRSPDSAFTIPGSGVQLHRNVQPVWNCEAAVGRDGPLGAELAGLGIPVRYVDLMARCLVFGALVPLGGRTDSAARGDGGGVAVRRDGHRGGAGDPG